MARAAPDGHTLLMATTTTLSTNPLMFRKLPYKVADFAPVALTGLTPFVLVAHPSVPASDAAGLVAYARANPGKLNYAMLGQGSSTHLVDEMLSGQLKGLGITADIRSPLLPNVPTFKESGLPQMVAYSWYGLLVPAATPQPVVDRLHQAVRDVLELAEVQAQLSAHGATPPLLSARQFGELIEEHTRTWERIVKPLNIQLD